MVIFMKCPVCGFGDSKVIDTRSTDGNTTIRRRRECVECQKRFTTYEVIETVPIMVIKKDLSRQSFDRNKLVSGMLRACEKRPVPAEKIHSIAREIEQNLQNQLSSEIPSHVIGEMVMEKLREVDEIAYIRFASVYREFKDINTFMNELKRIMTESELKNVFFKENEKE